MDGWNRILLLFLRQGLTMEPWLAWNYVDKDGLEVIRDQPDLFLSAGIKDMCHYVLQIKPT